MLSLFSYNFHLIYYLCFQTVPKCTSVLIISLQESTPVAREICKGKISSQIRNGSARALRRKKISSQNTREFASKQFPRKIATNLRDFSANSRKLVANLRQKLSSQIRYKFARNLRENCNTIYVYCNSVAKKTDRLVNTFFVSCN